MSTPVSTNGASTQVDGQDRPTNRRQPNRPIVRLSLPERISTRERSYELFQRQGQFAIYRVYGDHGQPIGWETIVIRSIPAKIIRGRFVPRHEVYPPACEWGKRGWSYPVKALDHARAKLEELVERGARRAFNRTQLGGDRTFGASSMEHLPPPQKSQQAVA
jgi:hypothetical protein